MFAVDFNLTKASISTFPFDAMNTITKAAYERKTLFSPCSRRMSPSCREADNQAVDMASGKGS